jgi:hypothetical protein
MKTKHFLIALITLPAASLLPACSDPFPFDDGEVALEDVPGVEQAEEEEEEICGASEEWLPNTPAARGFRPLPHPAGECPFYRASWQQFLVATQPDADGNPDFLNWATVGSLFQGINDHLPGVRSECRPPTNGICIICDECASK